MTRLRSPTIRARSTPCTSISRNTLGSYEPLPAFSGDWQEVVYRADTRSQKNPFRTLTSLRGLTRGAPSHDAGEYFLHQPDGGGVCSGRVVVVPRTRGPA